MNQVKLSKQLAKLFTSSKLTDETKAKLSSIYLTVQVNNVFNKNIEFYFTQNGLRCGNLSDCINRMPINWNGHIYFIESDDTFTIILSK